MCKWRYSIKRYLCKSLIVVFEWCSDVVAIWVRKFHCNLQTVTYRWLSNKINTTSISHPDRCLSLAYRHETTDCYCMQCFGEWQERKKRKHRHSSRLNPIQLVMMHVRFISMRLRVFFCYMASEITTFAMLSITFESINEVPVRTVLWRETMFLGSQYPCKLSCSLLCSL